MDMRTAKARLLELAAGEYHSMEYIINDHGDGRVNQKCKVYVHGFGSFEAAHWDVALQELENSKNGRPAISEDLPISKGGAK